MGYRAQVSSSRYSKKFNRENIDIAFLLEAHMAGLEHEKLKRQGFKHVFLISNGSRHTRGVVLLISGRVVFEHKATIKDKKCRFVIVRGKVDGFFPQSQLFTFYRVYVPPSAKAEFYVQIMDRKKTEAQGVPVCGGGFNITLEPHLDSSGRRAPQP